MNMDIHRVSDIKVKRSDYNSFKTVTVSVFTKDGQERELTLFTDDELKLEERND